MSLNQRPFNFVGSDISFLLQQVEFRPLFAKDPATQQLVAVANWSGSTAIYDSYGNLVWDPTQAYTTAQFAAVSKQALAHYGQLYDSQGNPVQNWSGTTAVYDAVGNLIWQGLQQADIVGGLIKLAPADATALFGTSYSSFTDIAGIRDVSGLFNNLVPGQQDWGADNSPFQRTTGTTGYGKYSGQVIGTQTDYATTTIQTSTADTGLVQDLAASAAAGVAVFDFAHTATVDKTTVAPVARDHKVATANTFATTETVTTQTYVTVTDIAHGALKSSTTSGPTTVASGSFLTGGELDPAYHPGLGAFDPANPQNFIGGLFRGPTGAVDTSNPLNADYTVHFTHDIGAGTQPIAVGMTGTTPANGATMNSVVDYTARMISQTVTQGGTPVQYLKIADPTAITGDPTAVDPITGKSNYDASNPATWSGTVSIRPTPQVRRRWLRQPPGAPRTSAPSSTAAAR